MHNKLDHRVTLARNWLEIKGYRQPVVILIILVLIAASGLLVYLTGGTRFVYPHTMYIPILLAALFFHVPGALLAAMVGGLVLGPAMPLDVSTGELQSTLSWVYRASLFLLFGAFSGGITKILEQQIQYFQWLTYHHPDTGMPNRTFLLSKFEQIVSEHGPDNQYAILVFRINNYSEITNTLGVEVTEGLLEQVSRSLEPALPDVQVCHLPPYYLGIAVFDPDEHQVIDKLVTFIKSPRESILLEDIPVFIDLSIGSAYFPQHCENSFKLLRKAVIAAQTAHKRGVVYSNYDHTFDSDSKENIALIGNVPKALEEHQFVLHYQPIIDLKTESVAGLEALARWQNPDIGLIPPSGFIPMLENTSLIYPLQDWIVETAIGQCQIWSEHGLEDHVAINISVRGLNSPQLLETLKKLILKYKVDPAHIVFEITETALMSDPEQVSEQLEQLHQTGIRLAIDDFGSGFSSLAYLRSLPFEYLKVDREFVYNLTTSKKDQEIMRASLALAKALNLEVIAEGVETQECYEWLQAEGCAYAQGFSISKPLPANLAIEYLYNSS